MTMLKVVETLRRGEDYMLERLVHYASEAQYTRHTSTRRDDWRMALREPCRMLVDYLLRYDEPEELHVDENFADNPRTAFGVLEARRHRERGVDLTMFLGLTKLVRQSFIDLLCSSDLSRDLEQRAMAITGRFFDKFELSIVDEWRKPERSARLDELQQTSRRLTNEKNRYQTAFQSMADPAFIVDRQLRLVDANQALLQLLEDEDKGAHLIGQPCAEVFKHTLCGECPVKEVLRDGGTFAGLETTIHIGGSDRAFSYRGSSLDDISQKFAGGIVVMQDVTERKRAEAEREKLQRQLSQADKSVFVSSKL